MTSKQRWKAAGLIYFMILFFLIPGQASAYIDPSVTSYAVQALAGVLVAAGAFFAAYGRKTRRMILKGLGIDDRAGKPQEPEAEIYMEELREETAARKAAFEASRKVVTGRRSAGRVRCLVLSVICGLAAATTLILRPTISFYLDNEGEFWFSLGSVIGNVLLIFGITAGIIGLVYALLPDKRIRSPRMLFAAVTAAITLSAYIQNHFMSSYLPVLTGDPIDWSIYTKWGVASLALWGGLIALAVAGVILKPRTAKVCTYGILVLLLLLETFAGGYALVTAKHENRKANAYCSSEGLYQVSKAGNVVILVSDTFEGTYMNDILERYPEYREMLSDITYYDNTTGVSVFTYFSYARFMTGIDFPLRATSEEGVSYCFEHETTIDAVRKNGWDVGYYTTFSPTENLRDKLISYASDELIPDAATARDLASMMVRSTLFQSMPQVLKPYFMVYTADYEKQKEKLESQTEIAQPYVENDERFFSRIRDDGLEACDGRPKYSLIQLFGVHEPSVLNADFEKVEYSEDVPVLERKIEAGRAQLNLLRRYLDDLKAVGVYDDTTVIMMADHGFNMRFYPVFLVKEAHREAEGFRTDHTPLSIREDMETILSGLTAGKSFTETLRDLQIDPDRVRYAVNYRGDGYEGKTGTKSIVTIEGEAKDPASYRADKDEFAIDDEYPERYTTGNPIISDGNPTGTAAVYGMEGDRVYGHTVLLDAFLIEAAGRDMTLKMKTANLTETEQRIAVAMDDRILYEERLNGGEEKEMTIPLPVEGKDRIQVEIRIPDARLNIQSHEVLGWTDYQSIRISSAVIE